MTENEMTKCRATTHQSVRDDWRKLSRHTQVLVYTSCTPASNSSYIFKEYCCKLKRASEVNSPYDQEKGFLGWAKMTGLSHYRSSKIKVKSERQRFTLKATWNLTVETQSTTRFQMTSEDTFLHGFSSCNRNFLSLLIGVKNNCLWGTYLKIQSI